MYLILTDAAIQHSAVEPKTEARISSEEQGTCNFPSLLFVSLMTKLSKHPIKYRFTVNHIIQYPFVVWFDP